MLALSLLTSACGTLFHSAQETRGQIVDADTGQPLEGVIVVAQWIPYYAGPGQKGSIHAYETVTDSQGRYLIPAWGPKALPAYGQITDADPLLSIFKSGYIPFVASNTVRSSNAAIYPEQRRTPLGVSEWNEVAIKLKPFKGSDEDFHSRLLTFRGNFEIEEGMWRNFPRMILAMDKEDTRLKSALESRKPIYLPIEIKIPRRMGLKGFEQ